MTLPSHSPRFPAVVGCVLAGGASRRMGGPEKAFLAIGGFPMVERVIDRLRSEVGAVIISANGDPSRFAAYGLPVIPDAPGPSAGPLAGVLAGLDYAARHAPGATHLLTVPVDTPFVPAGIAEVMLDAAGEGEIVVAASMERTHHAVALWPLSVREDLRYALAEGERRIGAFQASRPHRIVQVPPLRAGGEVVDPFFNANTAEDVAEAERLSGLIT